MGLRGLKGLKGLCGALERLRHLEGNVLEAVRTVDRLGALKKGRIRQQRQFDDFSSGGYRKYSNNREERWTVV